MKILSKPDLGAWKDTVTCSQCTSKMEIDRGDLKHRIDKRWFGGDIDYAGYYSNVDLYFIDCAVCSKEVEVHPGNIPYLLKEEAKKRCKK